MNPVRTLRFFRWSLLLWLLSGTLAAQTAPAAGSPAIQRIQLPALLPERLEWAEIGLDGEQNLVLLAPEANRIVRFIASTDYDSTLSIGGNSFREDGLNRPQNLRIPNRQSVYLLDRDNRRVLIFTPDLRLAKTDDFLDKPVTPQSGSRRTLNPRSFAVGPTGELFVLNADDNRVYKFDRFGRFESTFGGLDYGAGSLLSPDDIRISNDNFLYIPDTSRNQIMVFNNFGLYQSTLHVPDSIPWRQIKLNGDWLTLIGSKRVTLYHRLQGSYTRVELPQLSLPILDAVLGREALYIAVADAILRRPFTN